MTKEVLAEIIPSKAYDSIGLASSAVNLLYSKDMQVKGWDNSDMEALDKLLWTHAIRAEEYYGLSYCTENLEYSTHISSDIDRHSIPDNYSCELFERTVKNFKKQKNNTKRGLKRHLLREHRLKHL